MRGLFATPILDCSNLHIWTALRENRIGVDDVYNLAELLGYNSNLVDTWGTGSPFLESLRFKDVDTHYCFYGIIHAMSMASLIKRDRDLAIFVISMFGQHSVLNYLETTQWPLRWADLKLFEDGIWEMADDYMARVKVEPTLKIPPPYDASSMTSVAYQEIFPRIDVSCPPSGCLHDNISFLDQEAAQTACNGIPECDIIMQYGSHTYFLRRISDPRKPCPSCRNFAKIKHEAEVPPRNENHISIFAVGTHPSLLLEPLTTLALIINLDYKVSGLQYYCDVFTDLCDPEDKLRTLISSGRYDGQQTVGLSDDAAHVDDKKYDLDSIAAYLQERTQFVDVFLCTSPFSLCALGANVTTTPMIAFMGLPTLWKTLGIPFKELFHLGKAFLQKAAVIYDAAISRELLDYQFSIRVPLVRPLGLYTNVTWTPRESSVLIVARSKFYFFTLECFLPYYTGSDYPINFKTLSTANRLTFEQMSQSLGVIIFPWEPVLMAFYEYYGMGMPIFMPDRMWLYRLVFNYDALHERVIRKVGGHIIEGIDVSPKHVHPYPPTRMLSFDERRYWINWSDFVTFPHIQHFSNLQELTSMLLKSDYKKISEDMKQVNKRRRIETLRTWHGVLDETLRKIPS